jgi:hypothetical protein
VTLESACGRPGGGSYSARDYEYTTAWQTQKQHTRRRRCNYDLSPRLLPASAWLSNEYAMLPFWPTDFTNVPLEAILGTDPQIWEDETAVFQVDLDCRPMVLAESSPWGSESLVSFIISHILILSCYGHHGKLLPIGIGRWLPSRRAPPRPKPASSPTVERNDHRQVQQSQ